MKDANKKQKLSDCCKAPMIGGVQCENCGSNGKIEKKERVAILAERIKLLFSFSADLIKDKDLLKEILGICEDRQNFAVSAAPILGAFGMDYEEQEFEAGMRKKRARALLNLVETLEETEKERLEFKNKQEAKNKGREQLRKILGI